MKLCEDIPSQSGLRALYTGIFLKTLVVSVSPTVHRVLFYPLLPPSRLQHLCSRIGHDDYAHFLQVKGHTWWFWEVTSVSSNSIA